MISFAAGRAGIVFLGGANLLLFGKKLYIRLLGAVWELCESCAIYKSSDVWVSCWCFTVTGGVQRIWRFAV